MRRTILAAAALFTLGLALAGACSVSFQDDTEKDGIYKCESADDCEGARQECQPHETANYKICTTATPCIDSDEDGYGSPENDEEEFDGPGFASCTACDNGEPNGCQPDCDEENSDINPGAPELCDNTDNDCDGQTDEMDCVDGRCPLAGIDPPSGETQWRCRPVDGNEECVLEGIFSGTDNCDEDQPSSWGTCGGGEWSSVPEECKTR